MKQKKQKKKSNFYMRARRIFGGLIRWIFRVHVSGLENLPEDGAIICANHIGYPDAILLGAALPRQVHFLAKQEIFKVPLISRLARALGAVGVRRDSADVGAIKQVVTLAQTGNLVAVFPQGHRRRGQNPADTAVKNGIGLMAYRSGMPVLPICIKMKKQRYCLFRRIDIIVGKPLLYSEICDGFGREQYERATRAFFAQTCLLGGYLPKQLTEGGTAT